MRVIPWNPERWRPLFFTIWGGQIFSLLGSHLVQFALVWWLTDTTGSATVLAIGMMFALIPQIVATPFAGALVDRWNRRWVMIVADGGIALATAVLAVLFALDVIQIWHIYALVFVRSLGGAFHWATMQASTSMMVPEVHLTRVAGLNQTLAGVANIVSPPMGALLIVLIPMQGILAIDFVTAILAIVPLLFIAIPQPAPSGEREAERPHLLRDVVEGLRFLWHRSGLLVIIAIATILNLLAVPAFSLMPIYVKNHFGGGALQLATIQAMWGIGLIGGGLLLAAWGGFKRRIVTGMLALALQGIGIAVLGFTPAHLFWLAVGAALFAGLMNPIFNGSIMATLQTTVPHAMQGRVFALVLSGAQAMSPLGLAVAGPVADRFGIQLWYLLAGFASTAMGIAALFVPAVLRVESTAKSLKDEEKAVDADAADARPS